MDLSKIKAFALDVDGVMTDGSILCDLNGELYRAFNAKDGFGIRVAKMNNYPVAIITGGRSQSIRARFASCGISEEDVYLGSRVKIDDLDDFCKRYSISRNEVAFMGDDVPDIEPMMACGLACCPADAIEDVKAVSNFISSREGGKGCVRELFESVLRAQGNWQFDSNKYKESF